MVRPDSGAADGIFPDSVVYLLCIWIGQGGCALDDLCGSLVLNFTSFIPLPGAAAGAEIGFHTIFSIFFPTHILSVAILFWRLLTFYLPICVGGCFTATAGVWRKNKKQISA